ncbi:hypothetical protein MY4038_003596 [Beauveria bassiana]
MDLSKLERRDATSEIVVLRTRPTAVLEGGYVHKERFRVQVEQGDCRSHRTFLLWHTMQDRSYRWDKGNDAGAECEICDSAVRRFNRSGGETMPKTFVNGFYQIKPATTGV